MSQDPEAGTRESSPPGHPPLAPPALAPPALARPPEPALSAATPRGPTHEDQRFVQALRDAGLIEEMGRHELARLASAVRAPAGEARWLDLLERYYEADGDGEAAARRVRADRFFAHHEDEEMDAAALVARLRSLLPEVGPIVLERLAGDDGPLVLRSGEDFSALVDAYEETLDTDEVDMRALEDEQPTVSVHSVVRAVNGLLARRSRRERLVELRSDGRREAYVACNLAGATALLQAGFLEDEEAEELMDFGGW